MKIECEQSFIVASENVIRTQNSKVHPSPGVARNIVWAISPLTASCNMVTEDNATTEEETSPIEEKDSNLLCSVSSVIDDIFDVIKTG